MIDEDIVQRLKVGAIFILQVYKVATGTLLSLFIPQSCGDRICTLTENYENKEPYHQTALYWNMFSMFTFFVYYFVELRREEWAIKYLDIDNDKPDNCLREIIVTEPELDRKMDRLNRFYFNTLMVNIGVYTINIGMTFKMIVDKYHSISTLSCFASFSLLVYMKLINSFIVAYESVHNDKMMSAYMSEFVSFNVLDKDYLETKSERGPVLELRDVEVKIEPEPELEREPIIPNDQE